jgi:polysaccharide export outer membrane protein
MKTYTAVSFPNVSAAQRQRRSRFFAGLAATGLLMIFATGCQTTRTAPPTASAEASVSAPQTIREGDELKISFPGAPNLDSTQKVRRDGRITLAMVGEMTATGKTPSELEKELLQKYGNDLITKEVSVTVVSSSFAVFVSGAVVRPGKITADHPITALEAVMEAGGFDSAKANMQAVVVVRNENGQTKNYSLNLKRVLDGQSSEAFYLKPSDIIFVPEKFSWF